MRLMIYGDSNSWGFLDDGLAQRSTQRWPRVMAARLAAQGQPIDLIEECLPGRTTTVDDPHMGAEMNGARPLVAILKSHTPLDLVLIMLGTNDFKGRFNRPVEAIVAGLMELGRLAQEEALWEPGTPLGAIAPPRLAFIAPPRLGRRADDPAWCRAEEWPGSRDKSCALPALLQAACRAKGYSFFDANQAVQSSERDPIHWDQANQVKMGEAMAQWIEQTKPPSP